jgi:hypothetical protein
VPYQRTGVQLRAPEGALCATDKPVCCNALLGSSLFEALFEIRALGRMVARDCLACTRLPWAGNCSRSMQARYAGCGSVSCGAGYGGYHQRRASGADKQDRFFLKLGC